MNDHAQPSFTALLRHVGTLFDGHDVGVLHYRAGPIGRRFRDFHVLRAGPGPRIPLWTYISSGVWDATQKDGHGLEFLLMARQDDPIHVAHLAMVAYYHASSLSDRLDLGHTVPIGEPWVPESRCDHLLVSLPYPLGPDVEVCAWESGHARILWLLPITEGERNFKRIHGVDALEARFEEQAIDWSDPTRPSVA